MKETPSSDNVSTRLQRIADLARKAPGMAMTTLSHHIDVELLHEAFRRTRKDGAAGVDHQVAEDYAVGLGDRLESLLVRFKTGSYFAPPVRRVHIPKGDGQSTRPIGIPTIEDKVLQRAVLMVLEAIYEQDFLPCSYGFRPGRSAHDALEATWQATMKVRGGWVLEADIKGFFDTVDHGHLRDFLDQRVRDGVVRRMIDKWLKAGVLEDGHVRRSDEGTPQGGVLSPLLANVYLHEVLDKWFEREVKPQMRGSATLVRYADDFVMVFTDEVDAQWVMASLPARFGRYGLTLHPDKTRLIDFRRPEDGGSPPKGKSFDLLGFSIHWGQARGGYWIVKRRTASSRFRRGLKRVSDWCRWNRHAPVAEQHAALTRKLKGHYGYYGLTGNITALARFRYAVMCIWKRWLWSRSNRPPGGWTVFLELLRRFPLPGPRVVHSIYRPQRTR